MKRSVENLPDDEGKNITREKSFSGCLILDQPSAKRPMHTTSTSYSDNWTILYIFCLIVILDFEKEK